MEAIKRLRDARGWSQAKLAVTADMNPSSLNRIEQGKGNPSIKTLQKIADALEVSTHDLLEEEAPKTQAPQRPEYKETAGRFSTVASAVIERAEDWLKEVSDPPTPMDRRGWIVTTAAELESVVSAAIGADSPTWREREDKAEIVELMRVLDEVARQGALTQELALDQAEHELSEEKIAEFRAQIEEWNSRSESRVL